MVDAPRNEAELGRFATTLRVIGVMSGTSGDGIDAALVEITGADRNTSVVVCATRYIPFSDDDRDTIRRLQSGDMAASDLARWHMRLGVDFGRAALQMADGKVDLIASHGLTVAHVPDEPRATLQIGAAAAIAAQSGVTVVSDFRVADIAVGGHGAPLVSFVDDLLLRDDLKTRVALNLGGMANITYLPPLSKADPRARDTGPGNYLIDYAVSHLSGGSARFDAGGAMAEVGNCDDILLDGLLGHPYFEEEGPATTGFETFGPVLGDQILADADRRHLTAETVVATLTRFTARTVARAMARLGPVDEVIVSGGGIHNATLTRWIGEEVGSAPLIPSDAFGLPADSKEAVAFAILGNQTIRARPGNLPAATGALRAVPLGSITPGDNFAALMRRIWS